MTSTIRTALVTGATSGIGLETAKQLAGLGIRVLVHGRDKAKATSTAAEVSAHGDAIAVWGDFESFSEVRDLAAQVLGTVHALDILVNNAGIFEPELRLTSDGHEASFQVNHLSTFLLTNLLIDSVRNAEAGRVLTMSSIAHFRGQIVLDAPNGPSGYDGHDAYAASKLANVLFAQELAERFSSIPPTSNALHPGTLSTKLLERGFPGASGSPVSLGVEAVVHVVTAAEVAAVTGSYFVGKHQAQPSPKTRDTALRARLWEMSERIVGL